MGLMMTFGLNLGPRTSLSLIKDPSLNRYTQPDVPGPIFETNRLLKAAYLSFKKWRPHHSDKCLQEPTWDLQFLSTSFTGNLISYPSLPIWAGYTKRPILRKKKLQEFGEKSTTLELKRWMASFLSTYFAKYLQYLMMWKLVMMRGRSQHYLTCFQHVHSSYVTLFTSRKVTISWFPGPNFLHQDSRAGCRGRRNSDI